MILIFLEKKYYFAQNVTLLQLRDQEGEGSFTGENPRKYEEIVKLF